MNWFYGFVKWTLFLIFKIFYRLKIYGKEHIVKKGVLICPNHTSYFDPPIIAACWPHETHFLARVGPFHIPILASLIKKLNAHPIDDNQTNLSSVKMVGSLLKQHKQVAIFPEGARSFDGELTTLKQGVGMFAIRYQCPIVPVYITGAYQVFKRGSKFPKPWGKITCVFGSPISPTKYASMHKKQAQQAITQELQKSIAQLKIWLENGAEGSPP